MAPTPEPRNPNSIAVSRCVGDPEGFFADCYTRSPHLWHGSGFDDLLSLEDIDDQLTGAGLRRPSVRVVIDGEAINPEKWTREARTGNSRIDDLVHPGRLLNLFADGATIVLQSLQRWWPPLTRYCRDLESTLGHAVQANAYLTPAGAAGLSPHHDTHDVFVMQVFGQKHWTVREPLVEAPLARHRSEHEAAARQPVLFETDLGPGDCLYLPRGFIHSATAQDGASLHLTIGVLATTVHEVLHRLVDQAGDEVAFRRALPPPSSHGSPRDSLKTIIATFSEWLEAFDLDAISDDAVQSLTAIRTNRMPLLDGQLVALTQLRDVGDQTVVVRRGQPRLSLDEMNRQLNVAVGDRRLELPLNLAPAVNRLLDGSAHRVHSLSDLLDEQSRVVLVRRLIREGVLRTLDGS